MIYFQHSEGRKYIHVVVMEVQYNTVVTSRLSLTVFLNNVLHKACRTRVTKKKV